jgi:hypothetical protein
MRRRPAFTVSQVLAWADDYRRRTGQWPIIRSGSIRKTHDDTWRNVDNALRYGLRGLAGGSSLAQLLAEKRGARNPSHLSALSLNQILGWADAHHARTSRWPTSESGPIHDAPGETWKAIDQALRLGMRTLKGNSSLSRLLERRRGVRNIQNLPPLTEKQVVAWADAYHRRTRTWPTSDSGPVEKTPGETWAGVNAALQKGRRGFPGGSSLARLLAQRRGVRNPKAPPRLELKTILLWATHFHRRTRTWPNRTSGPIVEAPGETWAMVDRALRKGQRGLKGRSSLYRLLVRHGRRRRSAAAAVR